MKIRISLIVASSILLILSFPNFNLEFLAWFSLIPLLFAIDNQKPLKAFLLSYFVGALFFFGTIYWLIHVTLPGMIIVVLYLALYFGIFGLILSYIFRSSSYSILFFVPATWVTLEWLRSSGAAGFGWALLGHSQSFNLPMIQIADMTGAYGVSFLIMMSNTAIFLIMKDIRRKRNFIVPFIIAASLMFISFAYGELRLNNIFAGEGIRASVVQGNIPQDKKWDYEYRGEILNRYDKLTKEAAREGVDLIIWPEASVPGFLESERDLFDRIKDLSANINTPLLVGSPREDSKEKDVYYNSAILFSADGRVVDKYNKIHLVPFGEYVPFKKAFFFVEKFAPRPIGDFSSGKDYTVFKFFIERSENTKESSWRLIKKVKFSTLICFEDIFPELARKFVKKGADFLVNMTNDAWFGKTSAPYQHAQSSIFRAVENRVNVIRAANSGLSCFINQKGEIAGVIKESKTDIFVEGFKSHEVILTKTRTFYTVYGDLFAYMCIVSSLAYIISLFLKRRPV